MSQSTRQHPYSFIMRALTMFDERHGKRIVEIGSMRQHLDHDLDDYSKPCCIDGHSTLLFARTGANVYSVDIDRRAYDITKKNAVRYPNVRCYCTDGILFLRKFRGPIDLLYLDAWDIGTPECAEMHLAAYLLARSKFNDNTLVLIDDTDVDSVNGELRPVSDGPCGKGKLLVPLAVARYEMEIVFSGRQTLLKKKGT